jgi:hypothetical protein
MMLKNNYFLPYQERCEREPKCCTLLGMAGRALSLWCLEPLQGSLRLEPSQPQIGFTEWIYTSIDQTVGTLKGRGVGAAGRELASVEVRASVLFFAFRPMDMWRFFQEGF